MKVHRQKVPEGMEDRVLRTAYEKAGSMHHRLAQFYLRGFVGSSGRLDIIDPQTGLRESTPPKKAFAEAGPGYHSAMSEGGCTGRAQKMRERATTGRWALAATILWVLIGAADVRADDLDPSFSGDGVQITDFPGKEMSLVLATAIQADGKIVAVGKASPLMDFGDFAVARYNPNGALDSSFSGDGRATEDFSAASGDDTAQAVALQADGKILVAGNAASRLGIARYLPNGTLDPNFGTGGKVITTPAPASAGITGIDVEPSGKIVVSYNSGPPASRDFGVARYLSNGALDPSFSGDGLFSFDFSGRVDSPQAIIADAGSLLIAGYSWGDENGADKQAALARVTAGGTLDPSFSGDGLQRTKLAHAARAAAVQPDGKILAGGSSFPSGPGAVVIRFSANGIVDSGFGSAGLAAVSTKSVGTFSIASIDIGEDGRPYLGVEFGVSKAFGAARLTPGGALDASFSGDGIADSGPLSPRGVAVGGVGGGALQEDGKLVTVGPYRVGERLSFGVVRFLPDGDRAVKGSVSAKKTQKQRGKEIAVKVKAKATEDLDAEATGKVKANPTFKLTPQAKSVGSGKAKTLKLKPTKSKDARKIAKALKKGKKATAKLTVKLTDEAGNEKSKKLSVRLKR